VPGQAVVKIHYASANPVDWKVVAGAVDGVWETRMPHTVGYDFSGVIDSLDETDTQAKFKTGDEVFAVNWGVGSHSSEYTIGGAFAEYILIPISRLSKKPEGLSHKVAAASCLVGTTAYQATTECAAVTKGQNILVLGGAGSVGSVVIGVAKQLGVTVATTASERNKEWVESLGADIIVDYHKQNWYDVSQLKGFDAIIDTVGEEEACENGLKSGVLKPDGRFVSIVNAAVGFDPTSHPTLRYRAFYCLRNEPDHQDKIASGLLDGSIKMRFDKEFPFTNEGVREILKRQQTGKAQGKLTLKLV